MGGQSQAIDYTLRRVGGCLVLTLISADGMNRLTRQKIIALEEEIQKAASAGAPVPPLVISGERNFSAGADLHEIRRLSGPAALQFARLGQSLMQALESYPAPVIAAIQGHCMGGGLDLGLACHRRIAAPHAVFGHRGAALGLITGWGGTQRLPRLVGRGRALELFVAAEKATAARAFEIGLIDAIADDPVAEALQRLTASQQG